MNFKSAGNFLKRVAAATAGLALATAMTTAYVLFPPLAVGVLGLGVIAVGAAFSTGAPEILMAYAYGVASPYILADKLLGYAATGKFQSLAGQAIEYVKEARQNRAQKSPGQDGTPGQRLKS